MNNKTTRQKNAIAAKLKPAVKTLSKWGKRYKKKESNVKILLRIERERKTRKLCRILEEVGWKGTKYREYKKRYAEQLKSATPEMCRDTPEK